MGALALLAALVAMSGCGGSSDDTNAPRIPAAISGHLASLSDEAADSLAAGDDCTAEATIGELKQQAGDAGAEIPEQLWHELNAGIERLSSQVACEPAPVVPTEPEPKPKPKDELKCPPGQKKKVEHGHGDSGNGHGSDDHGNGAEERCVSARADEGNSGEGGD